MLDKGMKAGVRIFLVVALLGMIAGMAWTGGLYYWHFKVERTIRYLEDHEAADALPADLEQVLWKAGCRAVPSLVRASRPARSAAHLAILTSTAVSLINREPAMDTQACDLRSRRRADMQVEPTDPEPVRAAKIARLQQWWTENGAAVHQWWRFWSGNCRYPDVVQ